MPVNAGRAHRVAFAGPCAEDEPCELSNAGDSRLRSAPGDIAAIFESLRAIGAIVAEVIVR